MAPDYCFLTTRRVQHAEALVESCFQLACRDFGSSRCDPLLGSVPISADISASQLHPLAYMLVLLRPSP